MHRHLIRSLDMLFRAFNVNARQMFAKNLQLKRLDLDLLV